MINLFIVAALALLAFLAASRGTLFLLMNDETRPTFFFVPFEAGENRVFELVIGLPRGAVSAWVSNGKYKNRPSA